MDIDHFKDINDSYGHDQGDLVLTRLAATCAGALRDTDIFGRLGGEEFGAILVEAELAQAAATAERLRAAVEHDVLELKGHRVTVTISIGVGIWRASDADFDDLMGSLAVEVDVAESSLHLVRSGAPCEITLDAIPAERFPGVVHMIVPTADRTKATVLVKVRFAALDPRVLPEMSAKVAFLSRPLTPAEAAPRLAVPETAVARRDGREVVFVDAEGRAALPPVTLGETLGDMRAVTGGLSAGQRVVISPPPQLRSGDALAPPES